MISTVLVAISLLTPVAANAADTAGLRIQKSVSHTDVIPNQNFNWIIEVGCSVHTEECVNAQLVDSIPSEFIIGAAATIAMTPPLVEAGQATIGVTGQTVTVDFDMPLSSPSGQFGLANEIVTITIPVTVRNDLPYTPSPLTVINTATVSADNATAKDAAAETTITVPRNVATVASKSFNPTTVLGTPGSTTVVTVGGTNTSNSQVDSFVIQDPQTPVAGSGIFAVTLEVNSLGAVTWPAGAETAVVSAWDASVLGWVNAPPVAAGDPLALPAVTPANIRGVKIAFTSANPAMQTGETASFALNTVVRADSGSGNRNNTSTSEVSVSGSTATATAMATLNLQSATSTVAATKTIAPDRLSSVPFGAQDLTEATVTLTGRNSGSLPLTSLTISEPSNPGNLTATNALAPAHPANLTVKTFGTPTWPTGATAVSITYYYDDGSSFTDSTSTVNTLPAPEPGKRVTGFAATFTGTSMPTNAQATIPFTVKTDPLQTASRVDLTNQITVSGLTALGGATPANASDTAVVYADQLAITTQKSLTRTTLRAIPGQQTTATLTTSVAPYPDSSRAAQQIIQYDPPASETGLTPWYTYFNPTALAITSVPGGGATLTVQYRDGSGSGTWIDVPGMVGLDTSGSPYTLDIPAGIRDDIHGLRLVWDSPSGFVPGSSLTSNINYQLRETLRDSDPVVALPNADLTNTLRNCLSATGRIGASGPHDAEVVIPNPCPLVTLEAFDTDPGTGDGGGLPLYKQFRVMGGTNPVTSTTVTGTEKDVTTTRSSERTGVRLSWSTGGLTGIEKMTITDAAVTGGNVDVVTYQKGMYDAFDLVRINAISTTGGSALDPYLPFDQIAVEVYSLAANGGLGGWVPLVMGAVTCSQASPCNGLAAYDLSINQRADVVGVRFIYTERPGRTTTAQPVGAGVAVSTGNTRSVNLVYAIRDTLRSDSTFPVVDGPRYNANINCIGDPPDEVCHSVVRNDVHASAVMADSTLTATRADTIELRDAGLHLNVTKAWTGGPLPLTGIPAPSSRVTLRTTNNTPSPSTINELTILEPNPDTIATENPFEVFNLSRMHSLIHPAGATGLLIEVRDGDGDPIVSALGTGTGAGPGTMNAARTTALAWTAAQLVNAESVLIRYTGRMAVNAFAELQFDLSVRTHERTPEPQIPVAAGTVDNGTLGSVSDLRYVPTSENPLSTPENPIFAQKTLTDNDRESIQLEPSNIDVNAGKSFSPASQSEAVRDPITMTLTGTPEGSQRVAKLMLTDNRATFWNAFDFVDNGTITLPVFDPNVAASASRLQVEACTGAVFVAATIELDPTTTCEDLGGSWIAGPLLTQAQLDGGSFLPPDVNESDVTGIRVTVKRLDDSQWENPHAPTITIPLSVQRRENLRTGGPVPSEYAGNTPAPGETVLGQTTNTVRADVTGIWGAVADDSAAATYRHVHQTTSVQVSKLPIGVRSPGAQIPYVLTILNTGQRPIENPVITDTLPTDGTGAMVIFNPDLPTNYTFTVTGGSVPGGSTPIPSGTFAGTTPGVVTVTPTVDHIGPTKIAFTFPPGTVIGVGQTVTVRIPLMFRPGLAHSTELDNFFEVKGDRLLDACTAPTGSAAPAFMTSADYGCTTSALISIALAPALRAFISVQALDTTGINFPGWDDPNSQFIGGSNEDCRDLQDASGFSRPDCAPQTIPGQNSTWRLTIQNTGTTDVERLVVATRLPTLGDQTIVSNLIRNSAWIAQFNGTITEQFGPGTTVQMFYTTRIMPCVDVLDQPSNPAACGSDPATGWAPLPIGDPLFDPTVVTGLQFIVDFAPGSQFAPAQIATVDIGTTTVADLTVFEDGLVSDPLAVNSLSVSGISPDAPIQRISALDYSRSILSLATGSVTLTKEITGPAATHIPDGTVFNGSLVCTSLGESFTRTFQFSVTGGVITPAVMTLDNIPGGASCTVTETPASGQTGYTATTVIVDPLADPAGLPNIELVNDYQYTQFEVSKTVTAALGTIIPTNFVFEASCTFLGQPVDLDPLTPGNTIVFELDDTDSIVITGVPVNSECIVTETNGRGADLTVVSGGTAAPGTVTEDQDNLSVTITGVQSQGDPTGPAINWMTFNNRYDAGAVVFVEKDFAGGASDQFGENALPEKSFTIHVVCTFENVTQFDDDLVLNAANGWSETIGGLIEGAECVFTESDLNGADAVVFNPAVTTPLPDPTTGVIIVPGINSTATVTATNWFLTGALQVTKEWVGDAGAITKFGIDPALDYEFTLVCVRDGHEVLLPGGNTRTVNSLTPIANYTGIASGADCVLTETQSNGAFTWTVVDAAGDPVIDGEFTVVIDPTVLLDDQAQLPLFVENEFQFAEVSAAKTIDTYRPGTSATGPFELELVCTLDGRPIDAAEAAVQTIFDLQTVTWTELAAGADCIITETDTGGALATGYRITDVTGALTAKTMGDSLQLAPLRLRSDTENHAEFINSYVLASTGSGLEDRVIFAVALGGTLLVFLGAVAILWTQRRRSYGVVRAA